MATQALVELQINASALLGPNWWAWRRRSAHSQRQPSSEWSRWAVDQVNSEPAIWITRAPLSPAARNFVAVSG
jgi:hypothetical protein